ncbi:MAG: ribonuclease R, partial [Elusimicrobiota bacterium]|nr:ribonuclease R [Elusimicrobiota bacterium]
MSKKIITGKIDKHRSGFGFLIRDDGIKPDIYIKEKNQKNAMDNDRVAVEVIAEKKEAKPEGKVTKILERKSINMPGTYVKTKKWKGVIPLGSDNRRMDIIENEFSKKVKDGQRVYIHIDRMPQKKQNGAGHIIEILGEAGDYSTEVKITLLRNNIKREFEESTKKEAGSVPSDIKGISSEGRKDLREINCFTIDPESSKDFDDAVSIEKKDKGYRLGVHIADVSHFVKKGSAIDEEAAERGTSTYLPGRVIPMLPEELSNNICSLRPGKDRFAVTVFMDISKKGHVLGHEFFKSIINNKRRFTYNEVDKILEGRKTAGEKISEDLELMVNIAKKLRKNREKRGSINFEFPELDIKLNDDGTVDEVVRVQRTMSHRLIEEFMILSNETVAGYMSRHKIPSLYRLHEKPSPEKLEAFRNFIQPFGFSLPKDQKVTPAHLQTILDRIRNSKEEVVISTMMLRSLQKAVYSQQDKGHFALASEHYTHFTSPIRRYPDLVVHRILTEVIERGPEKLSGDKSRSEELSQHGAYFSDKEQNSTYAEREAKELKLMEYMKDREGEIFEGIISGTTSFGVFVELPEGLEGLIHVRDLKDDYYIFNEENMILKGRRKGRRFKLGESVKVKLVRVDLPKREVDFLATKGSAMFGATKGSAMFGATKGSAMFGATEGSAMFGATKGSAMFGATEGSAMFGARTVNCCLDKVVSYINIFMLRLNNIDIKITVFN